MKARFNIFLWEPMMCAVDIRCSRMLKMGYGRGLLLL